MSKQTRLSNINSDKEIYTSMDQTSVPELPDNWKSKRLEEISGETLYGASESAEEYDTSKPRYLRVTDLSKANNRLKNKDPKSISEQKVSQYILEKGDMLFARSGSVGKTYYYDGSDQNYAYGGYLIRFPVRTEKVNPWYLQSYTQSPLYWKWVKRITRTGAQPNINAREYSSLLIPLPPRDEQRKIASVLYNVDRAIEKTEEIIEQTRRVKQGVMQDLFTEGYYDHKEFEDHPIIGKYPSNWSTMKLEDLGEWGSGGTPSKSNPDYWDGDIPWLSPKDFEKGLRRIYDTEDHITEEGKDDTKLYPNGSIGIVVRSGILAHTMPFVKLERDMAVNQDIKTLRHNFDSEYLLFTLDSFSEDIRQRCRKRGTTVHSIMTKALMKYEIPIAPPEERAMMKEMFKSYDEKLSNLFERRKQLQSLKIGIMQDLLTGKVRTQNSDIEILQKVK